MGKRRIKNDTPTPIEHSRWAFDDKTFEEKQRRICESKIKYYFEKDAKQAALMARASNGIKNIYEYKCSVGGGIHWHIGHNYD